MRIFLNMCFSKERQSRAYLCDVGILLFLLLVGISDETAPGVLHDYCEADFFQADCPSGNIIVIEEARYGRMELGTCLKNDYGHLNCHSNVLSVLDQWCSGRQTCKLRVFLLVEFRKSCEEDLASYLQARYSCESVITPERHCCQNPGDKVIVTTNQGLISNHVTQLSGCGGIDCPWVLEASPGQMLNLSLFDFNTYRMTQAVGSADGRHGNNDRRCDVYANIKEAKSGARVTVCSGDTRYKHLYSTVSNSVEIQIVNGGENGDESSYFAIAFEVFGCSDPKPPLGGYIRRQGDRVVISCESTATTWEIVCRDGQWHGDYEQCAENSPGSGDEGDNSYFTREVYMVLVIAIAFVLAVAIVTTGIVCLYRHWNPIPSSDHGVSDQYPHIRLPDGTYMASEFNYSLQRQTRGCDTREYKRPSQLDHSSMATFRPALEKDKGYYSGHTYESPVCKNFPKKEYGTVVRPLVNPKDIESQEGRSAVFDGNGDPHVKTNPI